jgi:hypothetical protein
MHILSAVKPFMAWKMLAGVTMRPVNDEVECAPTLLLAEVNPPQL